MSLQEVVMSSEGEPVGSFYESTAQELVDYGMATRDGLGYVRLMPDLETSDLMAELEYLKSGKAVW